MSKPSPPSFDFSGSSVARAYDTGLVPALFRPWAERLRDEHGPWEGCRVLDIACGTGVVTRTLLDAVGVRGRILAADANDSMLDVARERCADPAGRVKFLQTLAHPLTLDAASVDVVVCQQGLQFFPDRGAAVAEFFRVLHPGGRAVVSSWLPVESCEMFGALCSALEALEEAALSTKLRIPFDHVPEGELTQLFQAAGFEQVEECIQRADMVFENGLPEVIRTLRSTPIGPELVALPTEKQAALEDLVAKALTPLADGSIRTSNATRVVTARKAD